MYFLGSDYVDSTPAGCPPLQVMKENIATLRALSFSWTKIARVLGISRQTHFRRLGRI